jgi:hypothetical protein
MRHGRPISPAVYDVLYGEWRLRVGWRREHAHRVWQAMQCQLLLVGAYSWDSLMARTTSKTSCAGCGPRATATQREAAMSELVEFLKARANHAIVHGHEWVQLVKNWQRSPRNWDRVRVAPGKPALRGRIVGATGRWPGEYLVDVRLSELLEWLERNATGGGHG